MSNIELINEMVNSVEKRRLALNLTVAEFSAMIGCHTNTYRNWKEQQFQQMQIKDLLAALDALEEIDTPINRIRAIAR